MKIENEEEMREINTAMWALSGLNSEAARFERGLDDLRFAIETMMEGEENGAPNRFAMEWLKDAFEEIREVYFYIFDYEDRISDAFRRLGFVINIFVDDLREDDPLWRVLFGDRNT